ncbi:MAG: type II glyceraldehyde-3-phosphate dehydrogenase, partial [Spirochaetales bacterium]|nr:type II glyceraldehyde-3-phosphate dehydrogenase [Spirochaetales bacterium]
PYRFFLADPSRAASFRRAGIPVSGTLEDLLSQADVILDASPTGKGRFYKELYARAGVRAVFQGAEEHEIADMFFSPLVNFEQARHVRFLKMTSCYVTGIMRALAALDAAAGIEKAAITVIRRVADPGDYHRGLTNALQISPAPCQMALDIHTLMPHISATGILVHAPITHSHVVTMVVTPRTSMTAEDALECLKGEPRIRIVSIEDGFVGNASLFKYARDLGNPRGDMHEIAIWKETVTVNGDDLMLALNIPQEGVVIPENIDAVRALAGLQEHAREAMSSTDLCLGIGAHLKIWNT